jgi:HTH-type transcriptional regulator/antitoxin HigA
MKIRPIKNTRDYRRSLREIEGQMHAKRNTLAAGDRLDVLLVLVEAWKEKIIRLICLIRLKRSNIS